MKKNIVRALAFALVLIMALGIIPLGAFAVEGSYGVFGNFFGTTKPTYDDLDKANNAGDYVFMGDIDAANGSVKIDASKYDHHTFYGDGFYDLQGVISKYLTGDKPLKIKNTLTIDDKNASEYNTYFDLVYTPHQHRLSYWYSDNTTHWRECLVCKKYIDNHDKFMFQNWHSDGDEDRVCDVCGHDIPYHDIDVEEVKGGKITVELEEAPHRKKIVATAEPEEGYKLKKIHFIKVRDDDSEQEITRRKTSTKGTWWCYMPTYDLKVTAEFVKKK